MSSDQGSPQACVDSFDGTTEIFHAQNAPLELGAFTPTTITDQEVCAIVDDYSLRMPIYWNPNDFIEHPPAWMAAISAQIFMTVGLYIACMENNLGKPTAAELSCTYVLKKSKTKNYYYLSQRRVIASGTTGAVSSVGNYMSKYFFFEHDDIRHINKVSNLTHIKVNVDHTQMIRFRNLSEEKRKCVNLLTLELLKKHDFIAPYANFKVAVPE